MSDFSLKLDLGRVPLFSVLDSAARSGLEAALRYRDYQRGEVIYWEGDDCDGLYLVVEGKVKIAKNSPQGKQQILGLRKPGELFGEGAAFADLPHWDGAQALTRARIAFLPRPILKKLMVDNPPLAAAGVTELARRLRQMASLVEELSFHRTSARLARVLLQMIDEEGVATPEGIAVGRTITIQDLANLVGTVREVATRSLAQLEQEGILRMERRRIVLLDRKALEAIREE